MQGILKPRANELLKLPHLDVAIDHNIRKVKKKRFRELWPKKIFFTIKYTNFYLYFLIWTQNMTYTHIMGN